MFNLKYAKSLLNSFSILIGTTCIGDGDYNDDIYLIDGH